MTLSYPMPAPLHRLFLPVALPHSTLILAPHSLAPAVDCDPCECLLQDAAYVAECDDLLLTDIPSRTNISVAAELVAMILNNNHIAHLDEQTLASLPRLLGLYVNDNRLTALRAEALAAMPNLVLLQARNNAITHIDAAWLAWLADESHLSQLEGNPLVCVGGGGGGCSCIEGYHLLHDGSGPEGATCTPLCPERVPRFFATACPRRQIGDTCNVTCEATVDDSGQPRVPQRFTFTCNADGTWATDAADGGVCETFLCRSISLLDQDRSCSCSKNGNTLTLVRCLDTWPQGLPPTLARLEVISRNTYAQLVGNLAWTDVAALRELRFLAISNARLTAVPTELRQATKYLTLLQQLDLPENRLTAIPDLSMFPGLKSVDLTGNFIERFDFSRLSGLPLLENLSVRSARISALLVSDPSRLGVATTLKILRLDTNKLTSLGRALTRLTALKVLDLHSNLLTALHGTELPVFAKLTQLNVRDNAIRYIDRTALFHPIDWDLFDQKTPEEALQDSLPSDQSVGRFWLNSRVAGVYMEGNPSNCTWVPQKNGKRILCDCDSGLVGAMACPRLEAIDCGTLETASSTGSGLSIMPTQMCDGVVDCPGGTDERDCDALELQHVTERGTQVVLPYLGQDNCTTCFDRLSGTVERGIFTILALRADGTGPCDRCDPSYGMILSSERALIASHDFLLRYVVGWVVGMRGFVSVLCSTLHNCVASRRVVAMR